MGSEMCIRDRLGGYFAERVTDLRDVGARAVAAVLGVPPPGVPPFDEPSVIVAEDLAPAETATLDRALVVGIITIPLVLIGPTLLGQFLPERLDVLTLLYWPVVSLLVIATFTSLYHVSTPVRSPWTHDVPGAVLTLLIWVVASFVAVTYTHLRAPRDS